MDAHECYFCLTRTIEPGHRYCPRCGWLDAWLDTESIPSEYQVASTGETRQDLLIMRRGNADLVGKVSIDTGVGRPDWIYFENDHGEQSLTHAFVVEGGDKSEDVEMVFDADRLDSDTRAAKQTDFELHFVIEAGCEECVDQLRPHQIDHISTVDVGPIPIKLRDKGRLEITPEILFFSERRRERSCTLTNCGGSRMTISDARLPSGVLAVHDGQEGLNSVLEGIQLEPGESTDVTLKLGHEVSAPGTLQTAEFTTDSGKIAQLSIARDRRSDKIRGPIKRFQICVDFGTSKVACAYCDTLMEQVRSEMLPLDAEDEHIPSSVIFDFVGEEDEVDARVGRAAMREFDPEHMGRVQAIKSQLRKESIEVLYPEAPEEAEQARRFELDPEEVAKPLLQEVRRRIHEFFVERDMQDFYDSSGRYLFSLPALDRDELTDEMDVSFGPQDGADSGEEHKQQAYDRQRRATLRAADSSGFHTAAEIDTALEPWCVLAYMIEEKGLRLGPGETVCVYDFGAGTLDVSVLRVEGENQLRELLTIGRFLGAEHRERAGGRDLAGNFLDNWLRAAIVRAMHKRAADNDEVPLLTPTEDVFRIEMADGEVVEVRQRYYEAVRNPQMAGISEQGFIEKVRQFKEEMFAFGDVKDRNELDLIAAAGDSFEMSRQDVEAALSGWIDQSFDRIRERCHDADISPLFDHMILTGGSSLLSLVQERAAAMTRNLVVPESYEDAIYAVSRGGPHLHRIKFTRPSPYELFVVPPHESDTVTVCNAETAWPCTKHTDVWEDARGRWQLRLRLNGEAYTLANFEIESEHTMLVFDVTETGEVLMQEARSQSGEQEPESLVQL